MAEALDIDLRLTRQHAIARNQQRAAPRLARPLRHLGAVGRYVAPPPAGSQQTVVKHWPGNMHTTGDYLRYLQQGKGRDGTDATLFGPDDLPVDPRRFVHDARQDPHQFRFSVSLAAMPAYFAMRPFVETLMARMQRDLGRRLDWVAAVHYDTVPKGGKVHAHVVLRGRDVDQQPLYIKKHYHYFGLRYQADRLATWYLGRQQDRLPYQDAGQQAVRADQGRAQGEMGR